MIPLGGKNKLQLTTEADTQRRLVYNTMWVNGKVFRFRHF